MKGKALQTAILVIIVIKFITAIPRITRVVDTQPTATPTPAAIVTAIPTCSPDALKSELLKKFCQ